MIVVDDRLSLDALAGLTVPHARGGPVATTWSFHYRLVRALSDETRVGVLTRASSPAMLQAALRPTPARLQVLDPRELTGEAARLSSQHGLNLLAAELLAAAVVHRSTIVLSAPNVGKRWRQVFAGEGVELHVVG